MKPKHLSYKRYASLAAIIFLLLIMMLFMLNLEGFIRKKDPTLDQEVQVGAIVERTAHFVNQESWLEDIFLITGSELTTAADLLPIEEALEAKQTLVFLNLPTQEFIEENNLEELLGIRQIAGEHRQKELNLVSGFLLGGFHPLEDLLYEALDLELAFSTKIYAFGKRTPTKESPIIWRNTYQDNEVYVVNGPFMETEAAYGLLSAIQAQVEEDHIYPVLNTRLMVYENFPYVSEKNKKQLEKNYNRNAMKLQQDILFPDLLSVNKLRGFVPNGFFRLGFEGETTLEISPYTKREIATYQEQIANDGGEVGLRYSGDIEADLKAYQELYPGKQVTSVLIPEETTDAEITEILDAISTVEVILGPFDFTKNYQALNKQAVYLPYTTEGFTQNGQEELEFISTLTAFGIVIHNLDLEEVLAPVNGEEKWTSGYKDYVQFLDQYRDRFSFLTNQNMTEAGTTLKKVLNSTPAIQKSAEQIELDDPNWTKESHYLLRTDKKVTRVENGQFKKIEENAYLITAKGKKVRIEFE